jgi:DNA-binding transcriptional LysR family regulator
MPLNEPGEDPNVAAGLDFRSLGQFLAICDAPNMATAARKMALSAPAVSQIVRRIERELGVSVFERSSRGIRLTPAGSLLRQRARELLEAEADMLEALAPYRNQFLPKLRVQIASTVANYIAPAIVAELNQVVGEIELKSGRVNQAAHDFLRGEFDILISSDDLPEISNLERFRLCRETLIGLVPTTVPKDRINLPWLAANLSMIRFGRGSQIDAVTEAYLVKHGLNLPRPIECRTPAPAIELIAQGLGWLITTPLSVAYYHALNLKATYMELPEPRVTREIFLIANKGRLLDLPSTLAGVCRAALDREVRSWKTGANAVLSAAVTVDVAEITTLHPQRA